jgi:hypothetical protein
MFPRRKHTGAKNAHGSRDIPTRIDRAGDPSDCNPPRRRRPSERSDEGGLVMAALCGIAVGTVIGWYLGNLMFPRGRG